MKILQQTDDDNGIDGSSSSFDEIERADPADCRGSGFATSYEKVIDFTYTQGTKNRIDTNSDIGIVGECLSECTNLGDECLSVTLEE